MNQNKWKIIAIIFIILFIVETSICIWGYYSVVNEEKKSISCYYEICEDYPDAEFDNNYNLCYCYDYDVIGNLVIAKTEIMD